MFFIIVNYYLQTSNNAYTSLTDDRPLGLGSVVEVLDFGSGGPGFESPRHPILCSQGNCPYWNSTKLDDGYM